MDASGCLEENEKGVEKKKRRKKKKETIESNVDKAVRRRGCARLYLCHTFLTPGTFPLEESFSPPAGIRPCWMNFSKCFRICNGTTIEQIFLSVSLSPLPPPFIPPEREQVFTRPPENVETQSTPKYLPVRDRSSPFFCNLVLSTRAWWLLGIFVLRSFDHIYMYDHESRIVYGHHLLQSGWNWRRALQFLAWFLFLLVEPTSFHAINHTFKARSWRTFEG